MNNFITTLLAFTNNPDIKDTNYRIALCLLNHCLDFEKMTILNLAEESYVSVSTVNRFIALYGFKKYSIFRQRYLSHLNVRREQMLKRLKQKKEHLSADLSLVNQYQLDNQAIIDQCCLAIFQARRIILIGSDEMCYSTLRFQGDFYMMGKTVLKVSLFEEKGFAFQKDDVILFFSMNGNLLDYNGNILPKLINGEAPVFILTKMKMTGVQSVLGIPQGVSELVENMILDYYMQEILYTYMEKYYVN